MSDGSLCVTRRLALRAMAGALAVLALPEVEAAQPTAAQVSAGIFAAY
jgi:hypothetical protein